MKNKHNSVAKINNLTKNKRMKDYQSFVQLIKNLQFQTIN
jgi:hypothetical protein